MGANNHVLFVCSVAAIMNSIHFINAKFTFEHNNVVVMFCNAFHSFSYACLNMFLRLNDLVGMLRPYIIWFRS